VVGKYTDAEGRDRGFLRTRRGRYLRVDVPGAGGTEIYEINDRGQMVGTYNPRGCLAGDPGSKGFLYDRGRWVTIGVPGAVYTQAQGINEAGVVVGEYLDNDGVFHGYRWSRGRFSEIAVPGAAGTSVSHINDYGDIVGAYGDSDGGLHGFVLHNRPRARFESFDAPGARFTLALGINNHGQIVGAAARELINSSARGFVLTGGADGTFKPIEIRGTTNTVGSDINNRGQIVAGIFPPDQQTDTAQPMDPSPGMPLRSTGQGNTDPATAQQAPAARTETTAGWELDIDVVEI
jgi:hypothetical protein